MPVDRPPSAPHLDAGAVVAGDPDGRVLFAPAATSTLPDPKLVAVDPTAARIYPSPNREGCLHFSGKSLFSLASLEGSPQNVPGRHPPKISGATIPVPKPFPSPPTTPAPRTNPCSGTPCLFLSTATAHECLLMTRRPRHQAAHASPRLSMSSPLPSPSRSSTSAAPISGS